MIKKLLIFLMMLLPFMVVAQTSQDTIKEQVMSINDKVAGIEERLATAENDLYKITKIKLSGYVQAQYIHYEGASAYPDNLFQVRRARIKFQYEPLNGVVFVLQPDFQPGNVTIKDAYASVTDPWLKTFTLTAGKFNRPNYEVEYSSSNREVPERSRVIRAIYPDERAIGAKLEIAPQKLPLKFQLAVFNGNDGIATPDVNGNPIVLQNTDYDNYKDIMARLTYRFKFGQWGGLTIGAHGYYGGIKANSTTLLNSDYTYNKTLESIVYSAPKKWIGVEAQFVADLWGGLTLKGEYITGVNSTPGITTSASSVIQSQSLKNDTLWLTTTTTKTNTNNPTITKNFSGWYVYLIKNIGKRNQIAVRYDWYNPNTSLNSDNIGVSKYDGSKTVLDPKPIKTFSDNIATVTQTNNVYNSKLTSGTSDLPYGTWTFAYSYYFTENIKFMVAYEMPFNEKVTNPNQLTSSYTVNGITSKYDYNSWIKQNTLTLRMQVKF